MGQEVHTENNLGFTQTLQTGNWKNGIYLVLLEFSGNIFKKELVVKTGSD
jgi:hypothetical protein